GQPLGHRLPDGHELAIPRRCPRRRRRRQREAPATRPRTAFARALVVTAPFESTARRARKRSRSSACCAGPIEAKNEARRGPVCAIAHHSSKLRYVRSTVNAVVSTSTQPASAQSD